MGRPLTTMRHRVLATTALAVAAAAAGVGILGASPAQAADPCPGNTACWYTARNWDGAQYFVHNPQQYTGARHMPRYMHDKVSSVWNNSSRNICTWDRDRDWTGTSYHRVVTTPYRGQRDFQFVFDGEWRMNDKADFWSNADYQSPRDFRGDRKTCRR